MEEKIKMLESKKEELIKEIKSYKEVIDVYGYEEKIML